MNKLSNEAVLAHHATQEVSGTEVSVASLDEEREWLELQCSNGHALVVEAHEGGSVAVCNQCGEQVDYREAVHEVIAGDSASATEI